MVQSILRRTMMRNAVLALAFLASPLAAPAIDEKELEEALDRFKKGMANPSGPARAAAVAELARSPHEKTAARLAALLTADVPAVRKAAAKGLGDFADYKKIAVPMLTAAINPNLKEAEVVEGIFESLGKLKDENSLPTLHRYFDDKDAKVASAALLAAGAFRSPTTVDLVLDLMKKYEKIVAAGAGGGAYGTNIPGGGGDDPRTKLAKEVLPNANKAMQLIAKEKYTTLKEWTIWWNKYKATFKPE
jgi:HEAT repeat protein